METISLLTLSNILIGAGLTTLLFFWFTLIQKGSLIFFETSNFGELNDSDVTLTSVLYWLSSLFSFFFDIAVLILIFQKIFDIDAILSTQGLTVMLLGFLCRFYSLAFYIGYVNHKDY